MKQKYRTSIIAFQKRIETVFNDWLGISYPASLVMQ